MATTVHNSISRVLIVDDDPSAREGYSYPIEELDMEPVFEQGPVTDLVRFTREFSSRADAILCDYHLKKHDYAKFDGDVLTAECYKAGIPGLLCTTYADANVTMDRGHLRYIPSMLGTNPTPDDIVLSLARCIEEIKGTFHPTRRPWRQLVRVVDVSEQREYCHVVVPGWNSSTKVRLYLDTLRDPVRALVNPGQRLHAQVNIGAERYEDLFFVDWEPE